MRTSRKRGILVTLTLLAAPLALLVSCGGNATAPAAAQTFNPAPVVVISGATSTAALGPVPFTFTFSQPVDLFPPNAVTVTNGSAAANTAKISANEYTLIITPTANTTGTMTVKVLAGAFKDAAGVANTVAASVTQPFNTVPPPTYTILDFNTAPGTYYAYARTDFGGTNSSLTTAGVPTGGPANTVVKIVKTAGSASWAGTTLSVGYLQSIGRVPLSSSANTITAVVYAPAANLDFLMKVEDAGDPAKYVQVDAYSTSAGWQTLTFNFNANTPNNTVPINPASTYNKLSIFPDYGNGGLSTDETFYVGPIKFVGANAPTATPLIDPGLINYTVIDFTTTLPSGLAYATSAFEGGASALMSTGYPSGAGAPSGTVAQFVKATTAKPWAGTTLSEGYLNSIGQFPFSSTAKTIKMLVYAPAAGIDFMLEVKDISNSAVAHTDALTATAGWQTLTFNFGANTTNTVALNLSNSYNQLTVFPDFMNAPSADETFYIGPVTFWGALAPAAPPLAVPSLPTPSTVPAAPSLPSTSVISLYNSSGTYTNLAGVDLNPNWGQSSSITDYTVGSATIKKLNLIDFQGIAISNPGIDITSKNHLHISYWTPNGVSFDLSPINPSNTPSEYPITSGTLTQGAWTDLEITINQSGWSLTNIIQLKFSNSPSPAVIYLDNIYFH